MPGGGAPQARCYTRWPMTRTKSAGTNLVIVESPAQAKTVERSRGPDDHVTAGRGRERASRGS